MILIAPRPGGRHRPRPRAPASRGRRGRPQQQPAHLVQAVEVVHVPFQLRDQHGGGARLVLEPGHVLHLRLRQPAVVLEDLDQAVPEVVVEVGGGAARGGRGGRRVQPVHDEGHERHRALDQPAVEVQRLLEGQGRGAGHQHEAGLVAAEHLVHLRRPLLEAGVHPLEGQEELGQVLQELQAQHAVGELQEEGPRPRRDLQGQPAGHEVRLQEPAQDAGVEEAHQPLRRLEEVQGMARGRGVEHHEVEALVPGKVEQLLHRHVLVAARQRRGDLLVEAIAEDAAPRGLVRRVALDQGVELPLGVEGHRPHAPALRGVEAADVHLPRAVAQRLQAEAGDQAPRGVDGADQHAAALDRGTQGQGGRGRRLADPARARHDEDAPPLQRVLQCAMRCAHAASRRSASACSDCRVRWSSNRKGRGTTGAATAFFNRFR
jgi:hypothetical protein